MTKLLILPLFLLLVVSLAFPFVKAETYKFDVGAYFYTWYQQGWGSAHWNDTIAGNCVDKPLSGWYGSNDSYVARQQLSWIDETGIDFLIHAWWNESTTDTNIFNFVNMSASEGYGLRHCILVDPFNGTGSYDWSSVYEYIYRRFVVTYNSTYYFMYGKPLLLVLEQCFDGWNDAGSSRACVDLSDTEMFAIRIVGSHDWSDWYYGDVNSMVGYYNEMGYRLNVDGHINIFPRFDELYIGRSNPARLDWDLQDGLYDRFWNLISDYLGEGCLNIVTITSWNEKHERTAIEPQEDFTSDVSDTFLMEKTASWIRHLRGSSPVAGLWYQSPSTFASTVLVIFFGVVVLGTFLKKYM